MWDHCVAFPCLMPGSEYTNPTIRSSAKAPIKMPPQWTLIVRIDVGTTSSYPGPQMRRSSSTTAAKSSSVVRSRYVIEATSIPDQRRQFAQRADDWYAAGREFDFRRVRPTAAMQEHRAHPGAERALDVLTNAVAHHDRVPRIDRHELQRRRKDARVRLHQSVLQRRHGRADQPLEIEVRLKRRQAAVRVGDEADADARGRQPLQDLGDI